MVSDEVHTSSSRCPPNAMPTGAVSKVRARMRNLRRALLAGGLGFAVSCIAACGGGTGLLSGDQANTLNNQLSALSADLAAGHCRAARATAQRLVQQVGNLPGTVDSRLRQDLDLGAVTVSQLAGQQCRQVSTPSTSTPATTSTPAATTTTTTQTTTPTHTTTTSTTTTPATTPTTTGNNGGPSGGGGLGASSGSGGSGAGAAGGLEQNGGSGSSTNIGGKGNG